MAKLTKADLNVLRTAANPLLETFLPWRGVIQRCWRLARDGYLVEAGLSVMPPHKLYAITPAGRSALTKEKQE